MSDIWTQAVRSHREGDFQTASQLYNEVLQDAELSEDQTSVMIVLSHMAKLSLDMDNDRDALRLFRRLLKMQEDIGDNKHISITLRNMAELYDKKDAFVEAIQSAERALAVAERVWNRPQMAASYHLLGILYQRAKMENKAVSSLHQAQQIWQETGDNPSLLRSTLVLSDIFEEQQKYQQSVREIRKALKLLHPQEELEDIANLHVRAGHMLMSIEDYPTALVHFLAALGRHRALQSDAIFMDAEEIHKIKIFLGDSSFGEIVQTRLGMEGSTWLLRWLDQLFPAPIIEEEEEVTNKQEMPVLPNLTDIPTGFVHTRQQDPNIVEKISPTKSNISIAPEMFVETELPTKENSGKKAPKEEYSEQESTVEEEFCSEQVEESVEDLSKTQEVPQLDNKEQRKPAPIVDWEQEVKWSSETDGQLSTQQKDTILNLLHHRPQHTTTLWDKFHVQFAIAFVGAMGAMGVLQGLVSCMRG